jgi:phospholipid-binding lipoprotein MlaA
MVLPVFGPSTARETAAFVPDQAVGPNLVVEGAGAQALVTSAGVVSTRAGLLPATRMLDSIALDKYVFVRDAYLQRRQSLIDDARSPPPPAADERMKTPGQPAAATTR